MSDYKLSPDKPIDVAEILKDLENYRPRRRGWTWRKPVENLHMGPFVYHDCTEPLKSSVPLPPAHYFENIDPQPAPVITTEIASGRFEDDIRRMRMAAHHGADHIMVIRTAGQSHFDGLIEGTSQGMGGVPITRKQVRAQRKALDMIEDEVGRPINYHSYVSGVAGPDIAVMFAEEGVNGVHQDPQYNVIYRNINMIRSFVDACESKKLIAWAGMAQIDGAHNANATAREAWKVMPELMVQHGINAIFSARVGINKKNICLSTVPPTATPAPCVYMDLPYAVALRDLFHEYRMRAQMNTKYIESSTREATVTEIDENGKAHDIETVEKAPDSIAENQGYREVRTDMPQAATVLMSTLQVVCGLGIVFCTVGSVIARDAARDRNDVDFNGAKYDPLRGLKTGALFAVVPFILYAVCLIMRLSSPTAAAAKSYYWFYRWIVMCPVKPIVDIFTKNAAIMADASVMSIAFSGAALVRLVG